jgi:hypothetical protein
MKTQETSVTKLMKLENYVDNMKLALAVIEQLGIENDDDLQVLSDISKHGIQGGYSGFIYYHDTVEFWNKNRLEIRKVLLQDADEFGTDVCTMIKGFNCLKTLDLDTDEIMECIYTDADTENRTSILNALSWYSAEKIAYAYENMLEQQE